MWVQILAATVVLVSLSKTLYRIIAYLHPGVVYRGYPAIAGQATRDKLASHPGEIEMFSVVSCQHGSGQTLLSFLLSLISYNTCGKSALSHDSEKALV